MYPLLAKTESCPDKATSAYCWGEQKVGTGYYLSLSIILSYSWTLFLVPEAPSKNQS